MAEEKHALPTVFTSSVPERGLFYTGIRWLWNLCALLGLLCALAAAYFYQQGMRAVEHFEPGFLKIAAEFVETALHSDVASALVIKMPVQDNVSYEEAVSSMKSRAESLNVPLIAQYSMHKVLEKKNNKAVRITEIFEFCEVETAYNVLKHNMDYLAHMPCRIALHEDVTGRLWILTMNLNLLIHGSKGMSPEMKIQALSLQDALLEIMAAGAGGKL